MFRLFIPDVPISEHRQDGYWRLPNSSEIWIGGLDDKDRVEKILGQEYATIFLNECSQIPYSSALTAYTRLAQNIPGLKQRAYHDLNPGGKGHWTNRLFGSHTDPMSGKPISNPDEYVRAFLNPIDNIKNLDQEYLEALKRMPERHRKRFYEGVYTDENENAFWSIESIDRARCEPADAPKMRRINVAIDPSGASAKEDKRSDDIGIVVGGLGFDNRVYLLDDVTVNGPPEVWGRRAIAAFYKWRADRIVAETNFGGDMVSYVIRSLDPNVPVTVVTASRGKAIRAEPVSVLYETQQDKARHAGNFPELEDQLVNFSPAGFSGERSPDRADALPAAGGPAAGGRARSLVRGRSAASGTWGASGCIGPARHHCRQRGVPSTEAGVQHELVRAGGHPTSGIDCAGLGRREPITRRHDRHRHDRLRERLRPAGERPGMNRSSCGRTAGTCMYRSPLIQGLLQR